MAERTIQISTGVSLNCTWLQPDNPPPNQRAAKLAICLHPWSWLGGQKNDPVLRSLTGDLRRTGYHILRYNSRGVGGSTGWSSFTGFSEAQDLEAVVRWTSKEILNLSDVAIIGYSHGSLVASLHPPRCGEIRVSHILVSYPLGPRAFLTLFRGSYYDQKLEELVKDPESRVLVLYGDQDEFTSVERYAEWSSNLERAAAGSDRLQLTMIPGASHFWHGTANDSFRSTVSSWLAR